MIDDVVKLFDGNFVIKLVGLDYDDGVEEPISAICVDASLLEILDGLGGEVGYNRVVMIGL